MATIIGWTDESWNPTTGCSKVSEGCRNCYAERISLKFKRSAKPWTARNAAENVKLHPDRLRKPYTWKKPTMCFVNSMSDLFHELIPDEFVAEVFAVMNDLPQHTFQVLTKRPERAATWPGPWTPNIWMGASVEDQRAADLRIPQLLRCKAETLFLSCEPLLGPVNLSMCNMGKFDGQLGSFDQYVDALAPSHTDGMGFERRLKRSIAWVIVGGESGPGFRPMPHEWARAIRDQCVEAKAAYFFKQSAAFQTERGTALEEPDGSRWEWRQYPGQLAPPVKIAP